MQRLIQHKIDEQGGPDACDIVDVLVPTQEVREIRKGTRVTVTRRQYPGYVFVLLVYNQWTKHAIDGVQGVIKFVAQGKEPRPVLEEEMNKILGIETEEGPEEAPFRIDQVVEVVGGPFKDFSGKVQEVRVDRGKARVEVSLFGRPTSVELDFGQLKGL